MNIQSLTLFLWKPIDTKEMFDFFLFFSCVRALNWEWNVNPNNYVCLDSFSFAKPFIKEKLYYFPTMKIITLILLIYKTKSKHIPTMKKCTPKTINTISKWSVYILYYYICCILLYKICKKINYLEPHEIWVLPQNTKVVVIQKPEKLFFILKLVLDRCAILLITPQYLWLFCGLEVTN